jgi:adenylate cyclase class IV
MTLDERIRYLEQQKASEWCKQYPMLHTYQGIGSAAYNSEIQKSREDEIADILKAPQFDDPYAEVRKARRRYKEYDLKQVGFVSHMVILNSRIIFYLCETEAHASNIDQTLQRILHANPSADLFSYEQEFCYFITRIDGPQDDLQLPIGDPIV